MIQLTVPMDRRRDARRLCDPGVPGLCGPCRVAAPGRHLWLYAWRLGLCSPWVVPPACGRPDLRNLAHDRRQRRGAGRRGRDTLRTDREPFGVRGGAALPDRLALQAQYSRSSGQRQHSCRLQGGRRAHNHHESVAEPVRRGWRRAQLLRPGDPACGSNRGCPSARIGHWSSCDPPLASWRTISVGQAGRAHRGGVGHPDGNLVRASVAGDTCYRKHPGRIAGLPGAHIRDAGIRRAISHRGRMSVAGLHRRCFGGSEFCCEAPVQS